MLCKISTCPLVTLLLLFCAWSVPSESLAQSSGTGPGIADLSTPSLAGRYARLTEHPGVFTTLSELKNLAKRINVAGGYSDRRFNQLAVQVSQDLSGHREWKAAYSGCSLETYTYAFSYEPQVSHNLDHALKVSLALKLKPLSVPPAGAAIVASRLALYAALIKAGATIPAGGPTVDQAATVAKQILMAWSTHGFRDRPR